MRIVNCRNEDGVEVEFSHKEDAIFFLYKLEGVTSVSNKVTTSENTTVDGSVYQGSVVPEKNIVITTQIDANSTEEHRIRREYLYSCFRLKTHGTFTIKEGTVTRSIQYIVENIDIDPDGGPVRYGTISLKCEDPFFKGEQDITVTMAGWESGFEFVHEWVEEGEEYGSRTAEITKVIDNDSPADYTGIEIDIVATGPVTNPAIYHTEEGEFIQIGTELNPFTMQAGDRLKITTGTNEKDVVLIRGNQEEGVNQYLSEQSEFIQLIHGRNTITYAADAGRDYMDVTIIYRLKYPGV